MSFGHQGQGKRLPWIVGLGLMIALPCCSSAYSPGNDMPVQDDKSPPKPGSSARSSCDPADPSCTPPAGSTPAPAPAPEGPATPACKDACTTAGTKRCAPSSAAGVEVCAKGADGCLAWTQDQDCPANSSCDTAKNDGTCKAGCTNDAGCSATNVGAARCVSNNTAEQTCTQSGACYVWKTTRTNVPQQCSASSCSGGQRYLCVASAAGACTQHVKQLSACPALNPNCEGAGVCTCNDAGCSAANANATKCVTEGGRSRLICQLSSGCYKWLSTSACAPDAVCQAGNCN